MKLIRVIIILLLSVGEISGQSIQTPGTLPTPNATSLGKYGDVPVSYYTGKADVSIPIYSMNDNGIPLNISLNYDTGGVRVQELPTWIGQNWSLNAGGVIVRTMKGPAVDELLFESPWTTSTAQKGYMYRKDLLNVSNWSDTNYLTDINHNVNEGVIRHDYEPDIFTFNFMGMTGKFFLSQDGTWKVQSENNIKVEINMSDNVLALGRTTHCDNCNNNFLPPKVIGKITLTDEVGNKYVFGNDANAIEYSNDNFFDYSRSLNRAVSWYLTKVTDRYNNLVYSLTYERGEYIPSFYLSAFSRSFNSEGSGAWFNMDQDCPGHEGNITDLTKLLNGGLTMPVYLKSIASKNGYNVSFTRSQSNYKYYSPTDENNLLDNRMQEWAYYRGNGNASVDISSYFAQDFYLLTHNSSDQLYDLSSVTGYGTAFLLSKTKMYKLDKININFGTTALKEVSLIRNTDTTERLNLLGVDIKDGTANNPSSYRMEYSNFNQLPNYISKAIDHWGYYKGTNFNYYVEGTNYNLHYATRNSNAAYLQIGAIKKIIYPTKGYTEFEFEPHSYSKFINENLTPELESSIAGGLRIKKITNFDGISQSIKTYKYTDSYTSSNSSGILAFKNKYYFENWPSTTNSGLDYLENRFCLNNLLPLSNFSGSHIAYSKVFEIEQGNGYKEFNYTDSYDFPDLPFVSTLSLSHSVFDAKISNDFKRGRLKKVGYYNETNQLLKEQINSYQSIGNYKVRAFNYENLHTCFTDYVFVGNTYEIEYSDFKLATSTENDYSNSSILSNVSTYQFSNYPNDATFFGDCFLTQENTTNSLSENLKSLYYYPFNSINHSQLLSSRYLVKVKTETYNNNVITAQKGLSFAQFNLNSSSYWLPKYDEVTKDQNTTFKTAEIDGYDNNGNITEFHQHYGISTSFIWLNGKIKYKIVGATQSEIASQGLSNIIASANAQVTSYTYNSFNEVSKIVYPNGDYENYNYDSANRLETITDRNNNIVKRYSYNLKN